MRKLRSARVATSMSSISVPCTPEPSGSAAWVTWAMVPSAACRQMSKAVCPSRAEYRKLPCVVWNWPSRITSPGRPAGPARGAPARNPPWSSSRMPAPSASRSPVPNSTGPSFSVTMLASGVPP